MKTMPDKSAQRTRVREGTTTSETFLRQVIENAAGVPFQLIFADRLGAGHYAYVGEGIKELLGLSPREFTEATFTAMVEEFHPLLDDIPADPVACRVKMLRGELKQYKADVRVRTASGEEKWLNDSSIPLRDQRSGKVIGALGILMDITIRKRMEEALRESEQRYRSLFDGMMDGVYRSTHEGRFLDVNPTMVKMFGFGSKEEMLSIDIKKELYFAPSDRDSLFLDTGQEKTEVFRMRRKDGSEIWVEDHGRYVHDGQGRVIYHEGILRDVTERMHAEKEISEWKRRYELVAEASRQVVYDYDLRSGGITWSGSVRQVLGYDLAEMNGGMTQWSELIDPRDRAEALRLLDEAERKNTPYEVEYRFRHKDGRPVTIHDLGFFIAGTDGKPKRMIGVKRDVTERKHTELLQNAIYQISQATDKSATPEDLFRAVHEIIGTVMPARNFYIALYDREKDLITFPYFIDEVDLICPPAKPGRGLTAYVLRTGRSLLCDAEKDRELRLSGEVDLIGAPSSIWVGVPLIVGDKAIGAMVVQHYSDPKAYTLRELHMLEYVSSQVAKAIEHKQAEARLRQSEEQFRLISENVADMIAVLDLQGRRLYTSPSYRHVLGEAGYGHPNLDAFREIHPEDRDHVRHLFEETVRTGVGHRADYRFVLPDGTINHVESQASVIKDEVGKVSKILLVSRDVTEKKKLEQQFLRSQRMESIGTLAGGIAHDLNNVLAPIMLSIQILQKRMNDPDVSRVLETLSVSAKRGSDVVKQVLAFSRGIEGERMTLVAKHLIDEVVKITRETFPRSIEIHSDLTKPLWSISADPTQIHQVLLNIFVNARDAMPYGGRITVGAENTVLDENYARMNLEAHPGQYVRISIADTGKGIPPKILDKIFEPFFTTKEVGKGTGLGLSTVLAIVRSHHGFVDVYSEIDKGTTFKVYIPAQMQDQVQSQEVVPPQILYGNNELILVVDDELPIREITRDTLEAHGYRVLTACDGTEALAYYTQNMGKVDVVITDLMMPILDGPSTIRALQKIDPEVRVIAASGLSPNDDLMKSTTVVREFLTKPYTAEKLLKSLRKVLSTS